MEQMLISRARAALEGSYSPYSGFRVGAALLCDDGSVYTGANVECASFSGTICAERSAALKAINDGKREFTAIAVVSDGTELCPPCGICRQFLFEFSPKMKIISAAGERFEEYTLEELLPHGFGASNMK